MDIKKFIENVKDQFDDPIEEFNEETRLKENEGWSSLTSLSIIAMIDEEYGVVIKTDDLKRIENIGELFNLVESKLNE